MQNKINVPGTSITLEIEDKVITVKNHIDYIIEMTFRNKDNEPTLDENGDIFEPFYWLDIKVKPEEPTEFHSSLGVKAEKRNLTELQKFFEFVETNKQFLFDICRFKGQLV